MGSKFLRSYSKQEIGDSSSSKYNLNQENKIYLKSYSNLKCSKGNQPKSNLKLFRLYLVIKLCYIKEVLKYYRLFDVLKNEYYINYDLFNKIISTIFKFDIPIICYSYLSKRIFDIMGKVKLILICIINI
jgi:hypothetical protein